MITYRAAMRGDLKKVAEMILLIYNEDNTFDSLYAECLELHASERDTLQVAFDGDNAVGFAHCALRFDYVEGTDGGTIGYLEGIYVDPQYRLQGVARTLVAECQAWNRAKGCAEFASDCVIDNLESLRFHLSIGFAEVSRNIHFVKKI